MRHGIFRILKGNVKLMHLCVCMGVYIYEHKAGRDACECAVLLVYGEVWGREKSGSQDAHKTEHFTRNAIYSLFTVFSGKSVSHRIMSAYCTDDTAV